LHSVVKKLVFLSLLSVIDIYIRQSIKKLNDEIVKPSGLNSAKFPGVKERWHSKKINRCDFRFTFFFVVNVVNKELKNITRRVQYGAVRK